MSDGFFPTPASQPPPSEAPKSPDGKYYANRSVCVRACARTDLLKHSSGGSPYSVWTSLFHLLCLGDRLHQYATLLIVPQLNTNSTLRTGPLSYCQAPADGPAGIAWLLKCSWILEPRNLEGHLVQTPPCAGIASQLPLHPEARSAASSGKCHLSRPPSTLTVPSPEP